MSVPLWFTEKRKVPRRTRFDITRVPDRLGSGTTPAIRRAMSPRRNRSISTSTDVEHDEVVARESEDGERMGARDPGPRVWSPGR